MPSSKAACSSSKRDDDDKPKRDILTTAFVFIAFHLTYLLFPLAFVVVPLYLLLASGVDAIGRTLGAAWVGAYAIWLGISIPSEKKLGRPWPWFENLPLFPYLFRYFPFSIERASKKLSASGSVEALPEALEPLNAQGLYVFGVHPHGALAFNRGEEHGARPPAAAAVP